MNENSIISLLDLVRNNVLGLTVPVNITDDVVLLAIKHSLWHFLSKEHALRQTMIVLKQQHLLNLISIAFEKSEIDYLPLKGAVIRYIYPEIWMRSSGDLDILVHKEDMNRAKEVLIQGLKMELIREGSHCWEFKLEDLDVEIHFRLINNVMLPKVVDVLGDGWKCAVNEKGHKYALLPEAFYLYHLAHMAIHILKGGCGIRPFIDLYLIVNKMNINQETMMAMLEKSGLTKFEKRMREISELWMCGKYTGSEEEELIVNGGTFGFFENGTAMTQAGLGGKRRTIVKRVFLPFKEMKYRYPILNKCSLFLPICWIRYWIGIVRKGRLKDGKEIIDNTIAVNKTEYNRALKIVENIGLKDQINKR